MVLLGKARENYKILDELSKEVLGVADPLTSKPPPGPPPPPQGCIQSNSNVNSELIVM
jgi:hypothetical protein